MKKLIIIVTVPVVLETWLKGQAKYLSHYYDVEIVTSYADTTKTIEAYEDVPIRHIEFNRKINLLKDLKVLLKLLIYFYNSKPDIVYTLTPKAGLLGMLASWLYRVPLRVHNVVGLPLMEAKGKRKVILAVTERITYFCATHVYANSFNLKNYMQKYLTCKDVSVIAQGSVNGVDVDWFCDTVDFETKQNLKKQLAIQNGDFVITFVGRIVKDKGINELISVFNTLSRSHKHLKLLLIGDLEEELDPISEKSKEIMHQHEQIIHVRFQKDIRAFLSITDLFVLPSYREGLPNVLIEAGSYGIPLLATNINGCNEVIMHEKNGLLIDPKNEIALQNGIEKFLIDKDFYQEVKKSARESIVSRYAQHYFWRALRKEFAKLEQEVHV